MAALSACLLRLNFTGNSHTRDHAAATTYPCVISWATAQNAEVASGWMSHGNENEWLQAATDTMLAHIDFVVRSKLYKTRYNNTLQSRSMCQEFDPSVGKHNSQREGVISLIWKLRGWAPLPQREHTENATNTR